MRFFTFVLKNVLRRRSRSTLTMTGMAVAVAAVVALVGLADGFSQSMLDLYTKMGVSLIVSRSDTVNLMTGTMKQETGDLIARIDGVKDVGPGLVDFILIGQLDNEMIGVQGWPAGVFTFNELNILQGECLTAKDHGKKDLIIGRNLAEKKNLVIGSTLTLTEGSDDTYHVVGIFEGAAPIINGMIIMLLEDAQDVTAKRGKITGCTLRLTKNADIDKVRAAIEGPVAEQVGLKGKITALTPAQFIANNSQFRAAKAMAWLTSAVALIIGGIGMLNTMVMSVFERTREIGILRAIGWQPSRVMKMILLESLLLSLGGGILGTLAGLGLILALSNLPFIAGVVQAAITPQIVAKGFAIAFVVGLLGAAYPAYRGARLLPTEAIRHE